MKRKQIFLLLSLLTLGFVSCSDSEKPDEPVVPPPSLPDELIYSFRSYSGVLVDEADIILSLYTDKGATYKVPVEVTVPFEIDTEKSTAVEGVHFSIIGGEKKAVFAKDTYEGHVKLKFIKKEEGKDVIVLKLISPDENRFIAGDNESIKISVVGNALDDMMGTWKYKEMTNKEWWATMWMVDMSTLPVATSADMFTFTEEGFTPNLQGDFKNYFTGKSILDYQGVRNEPIQEEGMKPPMHQITVLKMENINVNFSATNSTVRKALVGFFIIKGADKSKDILEVTIYDYEPTDFMKDIYDLFASYEPTDPIMLTGPLRYHFERN